MKYELFVKHYADITCLALDKYIFVLCLLSGNCYIFLQKKEMPLVTSCLKCIYGQTLEYLKPLMRGADSIDQCFLLTELTFFVPRSEILMGQKL